MGREKALLAWRGGTLLGAAIAALRPWCDVVIVVAGRNLEALRAAAEAGGAVVAYNPAPERGQLSSLQAGLRAAAEAGCEAAMITPVDCPPLSAASLRRLCEARTEWAALPAHTGRRGHPLLAGTELVAALLAEPATGNAREVLRRSPERIVEIEVAEKLEDLDTPEAYQRAVSDGS